MSAPHRAGLVWEADGSVRSALYGDVYTSRSGAARQAQAVFLHGAGLPGAWAARPDWTLLETGFGFGANFLATLAAWRGDPLRPSRLHYVAIEGHPIRPDEWPRVAARHAPPTADVSVPGSPDLATLGDLFKSVAQDEQADPPPLARVRFFQASFDAGQVRLTLVVGDVRDALRALALRADTLYLDGFAPALNPAMWQPDVLRALGRLSRRGSQLASWCVARSVRDGLVTAGFVVQRRPGLPPKRQRLAATYAPAWTPRVATHAWSRPDPPGIDQHHAIVIGAGLAGAATARALALRGWAVDVLEAGPGIAAGASGLPVGLFAPQGAQRETPLTQLTRQGVRAMMAALTDATPGEAWDNVGVQRPAPLQTTSLPAGEPFSGWVRPALCVAAWLNQPQVRVTCKVRVAHVHRDGPDRWSVRAADGRRWYSPHIVLAAAVDCEALLGRVGALALVPVRGQISWAPHGAGAPPARRPCLQGDGTVVPNFRSDVGPAWASGASFQRGSTDLTPSQADRHANLARLHRLLPDAPHPPDTTVRDWVGVRATTPDRLPIVGPVDAESLPGLCVLAGLGSRGLSLAALCGDLLAAQLHGDPLPLPLPLVRAMSPARLKKFTNRPQPASS